MNVKVDHTLATMGCFSSTRKITGISEVFYHTAILLQQISIKSLSNKQMQSAIALKQKGKKISEDCKKVNELVTNLKKEDLSVDLEELDNQIEKLNESKAFIKEIKEVEPLNQQIEESINIAKELKLLHKTLDFQKNVLLKDPYVHLAKLESTSQPHSELEQPIDFETLIENLEEERLEVNQKINKAILGIFKGAFRTTEPGGFILAAYHVFKLIQGIA